MDGAGKTVDMNSNKDELKDLKIFPEKDGRSRQRRQGYDINDICQRCVEENNVADNSFLRSGDARRERNKERKEAGRWICRRHYDKDYDLRTNNMKNVLKSLTDSRMGNQDPRCPCANLHFRVVK